MNCAKAYSFLPSELLLLLVLLLLWEKKRTKVLLFISFHWFSIWVQCLLWRSLGGATWAASYERKEFFHSTSLLTQTIRCCAHHASGLWSSICAAVVAFVRLQKRICQSICFFGNFFPSFFCCLKKKHTHQLRANYVKNKSLTMFWFELRERKHTDKAVRLRKHKTQQAAQRLIDYWDKKNVRSFVVTFWAEKKVYSNNSLLILHWNCEQTTEFCLDFSLMFVFLLMLLFD